MKTLQQSPKSHDFVQNPYSAYQDWRGDNFYFWQEYQLPVSARFEVVNAILRDRRFGREAPIGFAPQHPEHLKPFYEFESHSLLEIEPPHHTRIRGQVLRAFTSRRIQNLESEIKDLTKTLIANFPQGEFDLLPYFAEKIPVIIIARMIGVPESDAEQLLKWSHDMVAMYQAGRTREIEDKAVLAVNAFRAYIEGYMSDRKLAPQDDLMSHLVALEGDKLSRDEIVTTLILLLNAGHEATVHAIGNGVKTILEHNINPLDHDIAKLCEETMRFDPPLHMFTRYALEPIDVFGHQFAKGDQVGLLLGAANRDPEKYPLPDVFDPDRGASDHTSFGAGLHFCIGAPLARLELTIAIETLFRTCPNLRLTQTPKYADRYHFHGLENFWIHI